VLFIRFAPPTHCTYQLWYLVFVLVIKFVSLVHALSGYFTLPKGVFVTLLRTPWHKSTVPSLSFLVQHIEFKRGLNRWNHSPEGCKSCRSVILLPVRMRTRIRATAAMRCRRSLDLGNRRSRRTVPLQLANIQRPGRHFWRSLKFVSYRMAWPQITSIDVTIVSHLHWGYIGSLSNYPNPTCAIGSSAFELIDEARANATWCLDYVEDGILNLHAIPRSSCYTAALNEQDGILRRLLQLAKTFSKVC
jgi:hypothetical protein